MTDPAAPVTPYSADALATGELVEEDGHRSVVVASYPTTIEASMARARLEADGIAVRLVDAETTAIAPHLASILDGVKLVVAQDDEERARGLLKDFERAFADAADDEHADDGGDADDDARGVVRTSSRADRALAAALLGSILVPPALPYALWLAVRALLEEEQKGRAAVALVAATAGCALWVKVLLLIIG